MNYLIRIILLSYLLFGHYYSSIGQYGCSENKIHPDTLNFINKELKYSFELTDTLIAKKLELIAEKIMENQNCNFTILVSDKGSKKQKQNQWNLGYKLIMYFLENYQIMNTRLTLWSDKNLESKNIVIRLPTKEENSGPNCGVPIMPKLHK